MRYRNLVPLTETDLIRSAVPSLEPVLRTNGRHWSGTVGKNVRVKVVVALPGDLPGDRYHAGVGHLQDSVDFPIHNVQASLGHETGPLGLLPGVTKARYDERRVVGDLHELNVSVSSSRKEHHPGVRVVQRQEYARAEVQVEGVDGGGDVSAVPDHHLPVPAGREARSEEQSVVHPDQPAVLHALVTAGVHDGLAASPEVKDPDCLVPSRGCQEAAKGVPADVLDVVSVLRAVQQTLPQVDVPQADLHASRAAEERVSSWVPAQSLHPPGLA